MKIESESELERLGQAREAEIKFVKEQNEIDINKEKEITAISVQKVPSSSISVSVSRLFQ